MLLILDETHVFKSNCLWRYSVAIVQHYCKKEFCRRNNLGLYNINYFNKDTKRKKSREKDI